MNKFKKIKEKKLAKRIIKNSDRSACCNMQLKTSKPGRVMCTKCNKFCKIVVGKEYHYKGAVILIGTILILGYLAIKVLPLLIK